MRYEMGKAVAAGDSSGPDSANYVAEKRLFPLVKWAGGKEQELKYIVPNVPPQFRHYYEPFVGGGAVYTAFQASHYFINDRSAELINFYRCIAGENRMLFFSYLDDIICKWDQLITIVEEHAGFFYPFYKAYTQDRITDEGMRDGLTTFMRGHDVAFRQLLTPSLNYNGQHFIDQINSTLARKLRRLKAMEKQRHDLPRFDIVANIETAFRSAFYVHLRHIYNNAVHYDIDTAFFSAIFLFIRNFAYSGMFRYNAKGGFNVPYGGMAYNRKNFQKKVNYLKTPALKVLLENTTIVNEDFAAFFEMHPPGEKDFVFLDPPYDSSFSTYAKNAFTRADQTRLANYLINGCPARWMMIIKNTGFISSLYAGKGLNIRTFDKTYLVSFMNRNDKQAEHLLITNY